MPINAVIILKKMLKNVLLNAINANNAKIMQIMQK